MIIAQIRSMDISNGDGIGVSIFTQGCPYHCPFCHNSSTWSFDEGREFTRDDKDAIVSLFREHGYLTRLSLLGGEPLLPGNISDLLDIVLTVKGLFPHVKVYLWTGTTFEDLYHATRHELGQCDDETFAKLGWTTEQCADLRILLHHIDYLIDGRFIQDQKDLTLKWRGSKNQRIIKMPESMFAGKPIEL